MDRASRGDRATTGGQNCRTVEIAGSLVAMRPVERPKAREERLVGDHRTRRLAGHASSPSAVTVTSRRVGTSSLPEHRESSVSLSLLGLL